MSDRLEAIEAEVRRLMAKHANIPARGWTTTAQRATIHRQIDTLLDAHAAWTQLAELDNELGDTTA